ncbi:MAG: sugar ABC transporter ATP-binding protein [Eubacteriales bacterium]
MEKRLFLKTRQLTKRFGDVLAVDHVDMEIYMGEIRGLIGENGSGKSTISSMISGIHTVTSGEMFLENDRPYKPSSPADAKKEHISMIVQETGTIDHLTVAENIFLGSEAQFCRFGVLNNARMIEEAQKALDAIGVTDIRAEQNIDTCNFEQRKIIEIAKALYYDPELFIVDETTTALSQDGRMKIYDIMKNLRDNGKAVVFISHDLPELMEICDTLTVLRDGKLISNMEKADFEENRIKQTMVGREIKGNYYRSDIAPSRLDQVMLRFDNVSTNILKNVDLSVYAGEIVGIGGLSGSGIHDVGRVGFGMEKLRSGSVTAWCETIKGVLEERNISSVQDALKASIGYIAKNRDRETLILESSIADNLTLSALDKLQRKCGLIFPSDERKFADEQIDNLRIKCSSRRQPVKELSGGNKQKVSFGKWIGNNSKILVFDSPTRGVDVGVKTVMYQLLSDLKVKGYAILIISEELPELIGMSDRICILKDGIITKTFDRSPDLRDTQIIEYMI